MPYRPRDVYKGRRKYKVPLTIILFVFVALIIGAVALFYILQQFVVYDANGVTLVLPWEEGAADTAQVESDPAAEPTPDTRAPVEFEIVFLEPDFSSMSYAVDWEPTATHSLYLSAAAAADSATLSSSISEAVSAGCTGIVLQLKDSSGQLLWPSATDMAIAYATGGSMDYTAYLDTAHSQGLTVAACLSICADNLLAERDWLVTLGTESARTYTDANGISWLDPYNEDIISYAVDMAMELAALGFDEIILDELRIPTDSPLPLVYTTTLTDETSPVTAVCRLGQRVCEALDGSGVLVSAMLDAEGLRSGLGEQSGQDPTSFAHLFDRLYCRTDSAQAASDLALATAGITDGTGSCRFVPVCYDIPDGMESWSRIIS